MIKVGKTYKPSSVRYLKHGEIMRFDIPQSHRGADGKFVRDGFIQVMCYGDFDFNDGDSITIKDITAVMVSLYEGKQYTAVQAEVEINTAEEKKAGEHYENLLNDIPEELL